MTTPQAEQNADTEKFKRPDRWYSPAEITAWTDGEFYDTVAHLTYPERANTLRVACELAARTHSDIVETGCIRGWAGDGQSTLILAMLALRLKRKFTTFDLSQGHILKAQWWLGELAQSVDWVGGDSVCGLGLHDRPIGFAYLDSYDYDARKPKDCQMHQLAEVGAILGKMTEKAIIVMDDYGMQDQGKCALSYPFLLQRGWTVFLKEYQLVMTRGF